MVAQASHSKSANLLIISEPDAPELAALKELPSSVHTVAIGQGREDLKGMPGKHNYQKQCSLTLLSNLARSLQAVSTIYLKLVKKGWCALSASNDELATVDIILNTGFGVRHDQRKILQVSCLVEPGPNAIPRRSSWAKYKKTCSTGNKHILTAHSAISSNELLSPLQNSLDSTFSAGPLASLETTQMGACSFSRCLATTAGLYVSWSACIC